MSQQFNLKAREWLDQPAKKLQFNDALFTVVARKYAFVTQALSLGRDRYWKKALLAKLPAIDQPKCLDLACGPGDITIPLAEKYPDGEILGLDLCDAMLELANGQNEFQHVQFIKGDMCDTQLESESMDIVTGGYALRNAPDLKAALDEIHRVLRPGGIAAFLDFSKPPQKLLQFVEHFCLKTWGGFWGLVLHRNSEVYAYIANSLQQFPDRNELRQMLGDRGFADVWSRRFYFGALELLVFSKPDASL